MTTEYRKRRGVAPRPAEMHLELVSANVTSLNSQLEAVLNFLGSLLLLQETRLGEVGQRSMGTRLRERGWQAAWGKPQPQLGVVRRRGWSCCSFPAWPSSPMCTPS